MKDCMKHWIWKLPNTFCTITELMRPCCRHRLQSLSARNVLCKLFNYPVTGLILHSMNKDDQLMTNWGNIWRRWSLFIEERFYSSTITADWEQWTRNLSEQPTTPPRVEPSTSPKHVKQGYCFTNTFSRTDVHCNSFIMSMKRRQIFQALSEKGLPQFWTPAVDCRAFACKIGHGISWAFTKGSHKTRFPILLQPNNLT
jgi:hypothetical protein